MPKVKSEIAERAARRAHREIMKFALQLGCNLADSDWKQFDALVEAAVERAIAESQAPQPEQNGCPVCGGTDKYCKMCNGGRDV